MSDGMKDLGTTRATRRELLKKGLVAGPLVYVAPMILGSASRLSAQVISGPNPQCTGATCGNFINCSNLGPSCVCFSTQGGGGLCADGSVPCLSLTACSGVNNTCPQGSICILNSCCGSPVCMPPQTFCGLGSGTGAAVSGGPHGSPMNP